ncbi:unnamed protein product, partial [Allacma fusca]
MTPRRVQSSRVKRESIRHVSSPTAFDRTQSGFQTLESQPARYVRGARPDKFTIGPISLNFDSSSTGTSSRAFWDSLTAEQRDAIVKYAQPLKSGWDSTRMDYERMRPSFIQPETTPPIDPQTLVTCVDNAGSQICTTS